jgi:hypothetical protein
MTIILPRPPDNAPPGEIPLELQLLRDQTEWFIAANPIWLVLNPVNRVKQDGGGVARLPLPPRTLQKLRLIVMSFTQKPTITDDGIEREIDLTLLGPWDAEIDVGDYWSDGEGLYYEVVEMVPYNGYEVRALVVKNGHG